MNGAIVDVFPPHSIEVRPLCQAQLSRYCVERNREWAKRKGVPRRMKEQMDKGHPIELCGHQARYKIKGKYYCRKHAALVALDLVATAVPEEKLERPTVFTMPLASFSPCQCGPFHCRGEPNFGQYCKMARAGSV
jgi:hypothetical protein